MNNAGFEGLTRGADDLRKIASERRLSTADIEEVYLTFDALEGLFDLFQRKLVLGLAPPILSYSIGPRAETLAAGSRSGRPVFGSPVTGASSARRRNCRE